MKIGRIHHHLKARSHARLNHVSVLLSLAKISLAPNRTLEHCGQVRQGPMVDPYNRLEGAKGLPCCQTEDERNHPNGRFLCPISEWSTGHSIGNVAELAIAKWPPTGWRHCALRAVCFYSILIVTLATGQTSSAQQGSQENTGPLPPPPPNAAPFVESAPLATFQRIEDQNGSVRTAIKSSGPGGAKIELRDVIVAPDASVELGPIKGQVVIDTRSGEGLAKTGDLSTMLDTTKVASIAVNGKIEVQNQGEVPLVLMIYVVEGR
jgi:hypothetical protein